MDSVRYGVLVVVEVGVESRGRGSWFRIEFRNPQL